MIKLSNFHPSLIYPGSTWKKNTGNTFNNNIIARQRDKVQSEIKTLHNNIKMYCRHMVCVKPDIESGENTYWHYMYKKETIIINSS